MCVCSIYNHAQEFIEKLSRPTRRLRHAGSRQRRQTSRTQTLVSFSTYEFILRFHYSRFTDYTLRLKPVPCN